MAAKIPGFAREADDPHPGPPQLSARQGGRGREVLETLVRPSREEAGCRSYQLLRQADAPHVLQTVEEWADEAAADGHMQTQHVVAALAAITRMDGEPPQIVRFEKLI